MPDPSIQPERSPGRRKRPAPKAVVFVNEFCTGCGGAPICRVFCRTGALVLKRDPENYPFWRMEIDPRLCTRCGACISRGPLGQNLTGCPWGAIRREQVEVPHATENTSQPEFESA